MQTKRKRCRYCGLDTHQAWMCFYKPRKDSKPCEFCGGTSHLTWQCIKNPNRLKDTAKKLKNGKQSFKWIKTRNQWFRLNRADHYICFYCGKWLTKAETTLDHKLSRSRHPELRNDLSNLVPACWQCNEDKGSRSAEEFRQIIRTEKEI